ncbi:arginyltransferase [Zavarzinella formosa]|uniref:arginyltransferase n=1 Tax=Zavarzinella formosa TaxID=360055 RepID=UPI0002E9FB58|nr:arginyltransferase [Zavarzinella formosa]
MISLASFTTPTHRCVYLPSEQATMRYEMVVQCTREELQSRLDAGWRRFGHAFFRPVCETCRGCQSLRVPISTFRSNRSQRRAVRDNQDLELRIGPAQATREKLRLYDRFHEHQVEAKGWPEHDPKDVKSYRETFVEGPLPTEEWCYYLDGILIAVGYVDVVPRGLSAIYFYYDPDHRDRSLGTFNVMRILEEVARRNMPFGYLGYFVEGCPSVSYKKNFGPNEVIGPDGKWVPFR